MEANLKEAGQEAAQVQDQIIKASARGRAGRWEGGLVGEDLQKTDGIWL